MVSLNTATDSPVAGIDYDFELNAWIVIYEDGTEEFLDRSKNPTAQALWDIARRYDMKDVEFSADPDAEVDRIVDQIVAQFEKAPSARGAAQDTSPPTNAPWVVFPEPGQPGFQWNPTTARYEQLPGYWQEDFGRFPVDKEGNLDKGAGLAKASTLTRAQAAVNPPTSEAQLSDVPETPARDFDALWDEMAADLFDTGDFAALAEVWDKRQAVESGRLDPVTLFNLVAPIAQNPQHFSETWNAFATEHDKWRAAVLGRQPAFGEMRPTVTPTADAEVTGETSAVGAPVTPTGLTASQQWLRSREGQVIVDPNPETSTPGRFYDPIGRVWEPMEIYNERMAAFRARQAAPAISPFAPSTTARTSEEEEWLRAFTERRQQAAVRGVGVPADQQQRFEELARKRAATATSTPGTAPATTTRPNPFAPSPTATVNGTARPSPFAPTPRLPKALPQFGGRAQEGGGFAPGSTNPWLNAFSNAFNRRQQERFKRRGVQRLSFR